MRLAGPVGAAALIVLTPPAHAQAYQLAVKASFLPKFPRYIEWPSGFSPAADEAYQLCVIGRDPFRWLLDQAAAGELINGRAVAVRRHSAPEDAVGCHLAYVQGATGAETARFLRALRGRPVLTVTDARAGPQRGMIHFIGVRGRVRFFIDEAQAAEERLAISSRLLRLALGVRQRRT